VAVKSLGFIRVIGVISFHMLMPVNQAQVGHGLISVVRINRDGQYNRGDRPWG
jgi:hypothetical protein